jgi:hypothetical protein
MTFWGRWGFSLVMLLAYLGIFHLWMLTPDWVRVSCILWCVLMAWYWWRANAKGYFGHRKDGILHAIVILDIFLEGLLPIAHDHFGFYLCAIAFAAVIGPIHWHALQSSQAPR